MEAVLPHTLAEVAISLLALFLPGTAVYLVAVRVFASRHVPVGPSALLFGIGLSVGFWPLLLLYCSLLGMRFTPLLLWAVLIVSLVAAAWAAWPWVRAYRLSTDAVVTGAALAILTLAALVARLGDIQGLAVPMFGDSLHHTMITTIIADTGQVPMGYQPFVPVDTFTYHFGFHTLAAVLALLTGASGQEAVLVTGQVLIMLALPVAYLFGGRLFHSRLAGLITAVITGFVSVMPAYYVNWGRYTQLSGQILLPVALVLLVRLVKGDTKRLDFLLTAFCVAGLAVVHYRILIFYGLFALALALWHVISNRRESRMLTADLARVLGAGGLGVVLAAPWVWNVLANYFPGLVRRLGSVSAEYIAGYNSAENFSRFVGIALAGLGVLGIVIAVIALVTGRAPSDTTDLKDARGIADPPISALVMGTWAALMFASLWVVPGAIGSYTVAISLYIPLSALGGYGGARLAELATPRLSLRQTVWALAVVAAGPLCAWLFSTWHLAHPESFAYVHDADLKAFVWIRSNIPQDAKFLISSEFTYAGRAVTASDGGMWLPVLARRGVSVPALAAWTEHPIASSYFTDTWTLAALTHLASDPDVQSLSSKGVIPKAVPPGSPESLEVMKKLGVTHVYYGAPGGASKQRLDLAALVQDKCHFPLLYGPDGGVYVFRVLFDGSGCPK